MTNRLRILTLLLVSATFGMNVTAADVPAHKLSEWQFGQTVFGDAVDIDKTEGKVVVVEFWGVRCPPCIASLPHLAKLEKDHRDDGLIIIGAESQGSSKKQIEPLIKKAKVEYTITKGGSGPVIVSGIPLALIFNRAGTMVYQGHPADQKFESAVKSALKEDAPRSKRATASTLIEQQTWKNSEGKAIRAAVVKADDTNVTFLMSNGRKVTYRLDKLSAESRKTIEAARDQ